MLGTALLLLTITISISMLSNGSFTLEKIDSNPRFTLIEKVNKKRQESGCGRHSNVDL